MKITKNFLTKMIAAIAALCISAAVFTGCTDNNNADAENTTTPPPADSTETTVATEEIPIPQGFRPVAEGDTRAINKFNVDPLPANYQLYEVSQEEQGKLYMNNVSMITVMACNYKEDFQSLEVSADTACATIKINNMFGARDTEFEAPVKTKVAGFDAISYDFHITQNQFSQVDGKEVKTPVAYFESRIIYFFSDKDVYYCIFETTKDDWDTTIKGFEEFVANIVIDENAENPPAETSASETSSAE